MSESEQRYTPVDRADLRREFYATKPTAFTRFMRTFIPFQIWRFVRLNWKMIGIIRKSHAGQSH